MSNIQVNAQAGTTDLEQLRAEFEVAVLAHFGKGETFERDKDGCYINRSWHDAFIGFQLARRASAQPAIKPYEERAKEAGDWPAFSGDVLAPHMKAEIMDWRASPQSVAVDDDQCDQIIAKSWKSGQSMQEFLRSVIRAALTQHPSAAPSAQIADAPAGPNMYRKTALVQAEQFLPAEGKIPAGVYSDGLGDPRKDPRFSFVLDTKEGRHTLRNGDYICTGPTGEKWNVERSIFESTYELASKPGKAQIADDHAGDDRALLAGGPIDANKLEAMAKERPDECFLKGSGVLKLLSAIRQLERIQHPGTSIQAEFLFGFDREGLEAIADGLETGYEKSIDVGGSPLDECESNHIASTTTVAARFIRAVLTQHPSVPVQEQSDKGASIKTWQMRCNWFTEQSSTKLMVEAMKAEIAELRAALARQSCPPDSVPVPQTVEQAVLMQALGLSWLQQNAPERLTELGRAMSCPPVQAGAWGWEQRTEAAEAFMRNYADANMEKLLGNYDVQPIIRRLAAAILEWQMQGLRNAPDGVVGIASSEEAATICPPVQAGAPMLLNADELAALRRFNECALDGECYDVPKEMMQRLAEIGVVRRKSGAYYEHTEYGLFVLDSTAHPAQDGEDARDAKRLNHMEAWLAKSKERGFAWNSYDFATDKSVREQLDAVMAATQQGGSNVE